jgi:phospholipase/lecithinase/hemolysin
MKRTTVSALLGSVALSLALAATPAKAGPFDAIYAFGDSLSDVGNILALSSPPLGQQLGIPVMPVAPYVNGQFSNGNVWLQTLAAQAGLGPLTASLAGGTNYAYGGAETGTTAVHDGNLTDLYGSGGQIDQYKATHAVSDPNALYTIWIGSNDVFSIASASNATLQAQAGVQAVSNIDKAIAALAATGAKNFLVVTVPDLGKTPGALAQGAAAAGFASQAALSFNSALVGGYPAFGIPSLANIATAGGLSIKVLDTYALIDATVANPFAFGLTNVTDACFTGSTSGGPASGTLCGTNAAEQNKYLFWDQLHPTAGVHALIGQDAAAVLAVPEPATEALMLFGLVAIGVAARQRRG